MKFGRAQRVAAIAVSWLTAMGCVSGRDSGAQEELPRYATVEYRATDDVASRFAQSDEELASVEVQRPATMPSGRMEGSWSQSFAEHPAWREELLAATAGDRRQAQLLSLGLEALHVGDVATALARTREAWVSLQESRSRTLEEDLATSPVREAALAYASALLSSASRREGLVLLEKIVAASPSWLLAYEVMFTHYLDQGSAFLAEKVARRALAYANDEAGARPSILLARALRARSRPGEALAALRGAEARFPSESGITLWTGVVLHDAGFLTEACERFSSAYQRSRGDEHAAYNHAACLVRAERWGEARDVVKLALKQHPGSASLRLLAGNANRMLGHDADAYLAWRGFLDVAHPRDPRRAQVENALADLRTAGVDRGARPTP